MSEAGVAVLRSTNEPFVEIVIGPIFGGGVGASFVLE